MVGRLGVACERSLAGAKACEAFTSIGEARAGSLRLGAGTPLPLVDPRYSK